VCSSDLGEHEERTLDVRGGLPLGIVQGVE
jgi:hypothetical protein